MNSIVMNKYSVFFATFATAALLSGPTFAQTNRASLSLAGEILAKNNFENRSINLSKSSVSQEEKIRQEVIRRLEERIQKRSQSKQSNSNPISSRPVESTRSIPSPWKTQTWEEPSRSQSVVTEPQVFERRVDSRSVSYTHLTLPTTPYV